MLLPFIDTEGQGPDLVLLHGWGLHGGIFDLLRPALTPHFRLHVIDLPGFGRSGVGNGAYTVQSLAEAVLAVMPARAHVLGWSLGGMVATQMALQSPERVLSLITVASNARFGQADDWANATKMSVLQSFREQLAEDYEATLIKFLAITTMGSASQKDDIKMLKDTVLVHGLPAPQALHGLPAPQALRGGLDILREADLRADLKNIQRPMLRLYGRLDALVPVAVADDIAELLPQGEQFRQQHIFRKASHAPFLSHRDEFVEVLRNFISNN